MLQGYGLAGVLLGIGLILLIAEILLPAHGVMGLTGVGVMLAAVFVCARQNAWVALALTVALALASPMIWVAAVKIWPRTPIGRHVVLPPISDAPAAPVVCVGQNGVTVSELRPMGLCEFDGTRMEAISEHGIVPPGTPVHVVALANHRPIVRTIA